VPWRLRIINALELQKEFILLNEYRKTLTAFGIEREERYIFTALEYSLKSFRTKPSYRKDRTLPNIFYPRILPPEENTRASIISTILPHQHIKSGITRNKE
jgi:hypothetical protein